MKLTAPYTLYQTAPFKDLTDLLLLANAQRHWRSGVVDIEFTDDGLVTIPLVTAWVGAGGSIEGVPVFLEMDDAAYAGEVPEGISNREDGLGGIRTWATWHDDTHEHSVIGGLHYVPGNGFGEELTGDEIKLLSDGGFTVLTSEEYKALLPTGE